MKSLLMKFANQILSNADLKAIRGASAGASGNTARCFQGNDLKCTVFSSAGCSDSASLCKACELQWDCSDCYG